MFSRKFLTILVYWDLLIRLVFLIEYYNSYGSPLTQTTCFFCLSCLYSSKLHMHKLIVTLFIAFLLQFLIGIVILFAVSIHQVEMQLDQKIQQVKASVQFENDVWDLSLYNNDSQLLGAYPLYFITLDGFVLDRRSLIRGFLDTSDFKRLLSYTSPQTIKSVTGLSRRIYVKPVTYQDKPIAVVTLSYFDPSNELLDQIDIKLINTADDILSKISFDQDVINTSKLDTRKIPSNISFNIVDRYNSILIKSTNVNSIDRIPNFIDPSYVKNIISSQSKRIVRDNQTKELFFIKSSPFLKNSNPEAVLVIGQSIKPIFSVLKQYSIFEGVVVLFIICLTIYLLVFIKTSKNNSLAKNNILKQVTFNEKKGILTVCEMDIKIPYATNQFYLLQMLFSNPSKRWETDELLDRFGENQTAENSRKVYDAMISVNKKVTQVILLKLILNQNKTYLLNQEFLIS